MRWYTYYQCGFKRLQREFRDIDLKLFMFTSTFLLCILSSLWFRVGLFSWLINLNRLERSIASTQKILFFVSSCKLYIHPECIWTKTMQRISRLFWFNQLNFVLNKNGEKNETRCHGTRDFYNHHLKESWKVLLGQVYFLMVFASRLLLVFRRYIYLCLWCLFAYCHICVSTIVFKNL